MAHNEESGKAPEAPSGLSAIIRDAFGVPETPTLRRSDVLARIEGRLGEQGIQYDSIAISDGPVRRGAFFDAAGRRVPFPEGKPYDRCFVALIDLDASARWAHPAYWAFIPADDTGPVALRETRLPEHPQGPARLYPVQ